MTKDEIVEVTRFAVGDRVRAAVKAVLEQVLEEELSEHIGARHRERNATRTGERNGSYGRDLITPVGKIEQLRVPRDRDGTFATEVFEEYHRSTGAVEDAVLEMSRKRDRCGFRASCHTLVASVSARSRR